MTLKEKVKTYSFWISLVSALLILAKTIAEYFGKTINNNLLLSIATCVCGVMVIVGLLSGPKKGKVTMEDLTKETEEKSEETSQMIETIKEDISNNMEMTIAEQLEYLKNLKDMEKSEDNKETEIQIVSNDEETFDEEKPAGDNCANNDVAEEVGVQSGIVEEKEIIEETHEQFTHEQFFKYLCTENFSKEELKEILELVVEKFNII